MGCEHHLNVCLAQQPAPLLLYKKQPEMSITTAMSEYLEIFGKTPWRHESDGMYFVGIGKKTTDAQCAFQRFAGNDSMAIMNAGVYLIVPAEYTYWGKMFDILLSMSDG